MSFLIALHGLPACLPVWREKGRQGGDHIDNGAGRGDCSAHGSWYTYRQPRLDKQGISGQYTEKRLTQGAGLSFAWYQKWAAGEAEHAAIVAGGQTVSFGALQRRVDEAAEALRLAGVSPATRLLFGFPPDSIEGIIALLATFSLSAQAVLPDFDWDSRDYSVNLGPFADCPVLGKNQAGELTVAPGDCDRLTRPGADGAGIWLFTSGTTSHPKPWFRSLSFLNANVECVRARLPVDLANSRPNSLCVLPLYHGFGLVNALFVAHSIGGTVFLDNIGDARAIVDALYDHDIQVLYAWPVQYDGMVDADLWRAEKPAALRWCVSSSYQLGQGTAVEFARLSGCPLRQQYGMTETGPLCVETGSTAGTVTASVGKPVDGVELCILDPDDRVLTAGQEGRIAVRVKGQWLPADSLLIDGFWPNGDIGRLDDSGALFLTRRELPFTDERSEYDKNS